MDDTLKLCNYALLFMGLSMAAVTGDSVSCGFPAIYNFGDSNSDTGGRSAALSEVHSPNGLSFFGHPSGRFCDGRLIIDFIAEKLKLPYLSPYLDSLGANFRHGANFATGGSSIRPGGYSPFHLGIQISQFLQFKSRTTELYNHTISNAPGNNRPLKRSLPRPQEFSKALYTFDIGQNDLAYGFEHSTQEQVRASIPDILSQFASAVHVCKQNHIVDITKNKLYKVGARTFWVHNTGPIGCLPYNVIYDQSKPGNLDPSGCLKPQNERAQEFNQQLKDILLKLRIQLPLAALTYVDAYSAKCALISNAKNQGFVDPFEFCCGSYYGYHIDCGKKARVNGTVYGNPCKHPSSHISWDGIHYSQAANLWVVNHILNGSLSDPPVEIEMACHAYKQSKA